MPRPPTLNRRELLASAVAAGTLALAKGDGNSIMGADAAARIQIVDPHVHVWTHDPKFPFPADLKNAPKDDALPGTLVELMQAHGVARTVIVHVIYYRWDCRFTAATVRETPSKFMGVCRINPESENPAKELDHWTSEGFHGVRLSPGDGPEGNWINNRRQMDLIWSRAAELKIPMCILCSTSRLPDVERLIERHDGKLDVCIDHMADCAIDKPEELKKLLAARHPRVSVKISHLWSLSHEAYPYRDTHEQVRRLYDAFGPERLMWGTDWPGVEGYCGYGRALALYRDEIKFFNDEDRRWILGGTALKLWPFGAASS